MNKIRKLNKENFLKNKANEYYPVSLTNKLFEVYEKIHGIIMDHDMEVFCTVVDKLKDA
jgi:hypothetical protein